jgi:hypothetical protein
MMGVPAEVLFRSSASQASCGLVQLHLEGLLGFLVEVEDELGARGVDAHGIEHVVATHDGEVTLRASDLAETHVTSVGGIQLGLDVRIGKENEVEGSGYGVGVLPGERVSTAREFLP